MIYYEMGRVRLELLRPVNGNKLLDSTGLEVISIIDRVYTDFRLIVNFVSFITALLINNSLFCYDTKFTISLIVKSVYDRS